MFYVVQSGLSSNISSLLLSLHNDGWSRYSIYYVLVLKSMACLLNAYQWMSDHNTSKCPFFADDQPILTNLCFSSQSPVNSCSSYTTPHPVSKYSETYFYRCEWVDEILVTFKVTSLLLIWCMCPYYVELHCLSILLMFSLYLLAVL